jgi:uncharacterized protein YecE (DUF72 family)
VPLYVGTSGWQYDHWKELFYPRGLPLTDELSWYAERFATVESNNAFYRLPERRTFENWAGRTPDDFVMAVKVSRFLTHIKRLKEPAEPVARFLGRAAGLGRKFGPALLQLPPQLQLDTDRLRETLEEFPAGVRVAVEFRHDSWWTDEVPGILEEHGAALCLADRYRPVAPLWRTADWAYVRFHSGRAQPRGCYGREALGHWVERIAERWPADADVFAYFNNDRYGCALRDAITFAELATDAGLHPTRVPPRADLHLD